MSALALRIIDTFEFQRLRDIKQLGLCYLVYPTAVHTRFEHSLGVYHLAGKMLDILLQKYPVQEYEIPGLGRRWLTPKLAEYIKIAGLCHDIGHGPFSHIFDHLVSGVDHPNRRHEVRSCLILEKICRRIGIKQKYIDFMKSIIHPGPEHVGALYQIVSNNLNNIDVDKFDYIIRDALNLGQNVSFDPNRLINEIIIDIKGNIAFPKHSSINVYELFHSRYLLHKKAYHHKTVKILEIMVQDIFRMMDPILHISNSILDMEEFCRYTDHSIFSQLILPEHPLSLTGAARIYERIHLRHFYKLLAQDDSLERLQEYQKSIQNVFKVPPDQLTITICEIGFVNPDKPDPFENTYFYDKKEDGHTFVLQKKYYSNLIGRSSETFYLLLLKDEQFEQIVPFMRDYLKKLKI